LAHAAGSEFKPETNQEKRTQRPRDARFLCISCPLHRGAMGAHE